MRKFYFSSLFIAVFAFCGCNSDNSLLSPNGNGTSGSITRFATLGEFMYVVNPSELQTFDISDPENPVLLSRLETDPGLETIFIYENRIYLGSRLGLFIIGIDDPASPVLLSQTGRMDVELLGACDPVVVRDDFAYSTVKIIENICGNVNARSALLVFDVSNSEEPLELASFDLNIPNGLGIKDNYLFICDTGADLLKVFSIIDPANTIPRVDLDFALADPIDLIVDNDRMIVSTAEDFKILDVSDIHSIEIVKIISRVE